MMSVFFVAGCVAYAPDSGPGYAAEPAYEAWPFFGVYGGYNGMYGGNYGLHGGRYIAGPRSLGRGVSRGGGNGHGGGRSRR